MINSIKDILQINKNIKNFPWLSFSLILPKAKLERINKLFILLTLVDLKVLFRGCRKFESQYLMIGYYSNSNSKSKGGNMNEKYKLLFHGLYVQTFMLAYT